MIIDIFLQPHNYFDSLPIVGKHIVWWLLSFVNFFFNNFTFIIIKYLSESTQIQIVWHKIIDARNDGSYVLRIYVNRYRHFICIHNNFTRAKNVCKIYDLIIINKQLMVKIEKIINFKTFTLTITTDRNFWYINKLNSFWLKISNYFGTIRWFCIIICGCSWCC